MLPLKAGESHTLNVEFIPHQAQSMSVLVNDTLLHTFSFAQSQQIQTLSVSIPGELLKSLTFRSHQATEASYGANKSGEDFVIFEFERFTFQIASE
ncbi:hypothetical protein CSA56_15680 [candidate division KSB3 bacterium]|uniref:Uncharacterized protein n=1 Tax=candidate division KSB3 bacterium TaxID=2044937 RepID=A0A2G6K9I0_9BACT|nr:MAG: hypothetical protein CSA56_15680 [candidate division KSB3 bacterium]